MNVLPDPSVARVAAEFEKHEMWYVDGAPGPMIAMKPRIGVDADPESATSGKAIVMFIDGARERHPVVEGVAVDGDTVTGQAPYWDNAALVFRPLTIALAQARGMKDALGLDPNNDDHWALFRSHFPQVG